MPRPIGEFNKEWRFLSNFYELERLPDMDFAGSDIGYPTVEHAYQAAKTMDRQERKRISLLLKPGTAKYEARKLVLRDDWDAVKDKVMWHYLGLKFNVGGRLCEYLVHTMPRILVEGNWWHDNYWGSCYCAHCGARGQNKLGKMLMKLREERFNDPNWR